MEGRIMRVMTVGMMDCQGIACGHTRWLNNIIWWCGLGWWEENFWLLQTPCWEMVYHRYYHAVFSLFLTPVVGSFFYFFPVIPCDDASSHVLPRSTCCGIGMFEFVIDVSGCRVIGVIIHSCIIAEVFWSYYSYIMFCCTFAFSYTCAGSSMNWLLIKGLWPKCQAFVHTI